MSDNLITAEDARQLLSYNPETGKITWRISLGNRVKAGGIAGTQKSKKYSMIMVRGKLYKAHRLAWLMTYGNWPEKYLDHIDGDKSNNRLNNLRQASHSENCRNRGIPSNNTSGYKGVSWHNATKKWKSQIYFNRRAIHIGLFLTAEEAHLAYCKAAVEFYGEFACFS